MIHAWNFTTQTIYLWSKVSHLDHLGMHKWNQKPWQSRDGYSLHYSLHKHLCLEDTDNSTSEAQYHLQSLTTRGSHSFHQNTCGWLSNITPKLSQPIWMTARGHWGLSLLFYFPESWLLPICLSLTWNLFLVALTLYCCLGIWFSSWDEPFDFKFRGSSAWYPNITSIAISILVLQLQPLSKLHHGLTESLHTPAPDFRNTVCPAYYRQACECYVLSRCIWLIVIPIGCSMQVRY